METVSAKELARQLGVSRQRVYFLLKRGRFAGAKRDAEGRWVIPADAKLMPGRSRVRLLTMLVWEAKGAPKRVRDRAGVSDGLVVLVRGAGWENRLRPHLDRLMPGGWRSVGEMRWKGLEWSIVAGR